MHENRTKPAASGAERQERLQKRRFDAEQGIKEYREAEAALRANYERLKAERLAREAQK
jgi:hypothetical protein